MNLKSFLLIIASVLFTARATAQINESDTVKLHLRLSVSGNYQQGNVEIFTLRNRLDVLFAPDKNWVLKSQNSSLYQAFYSKKADNDIYSRNYLYFQPHRKIYPFAIAYISTNYRRKLDRRYFAGAGASWQAVNNAAIVLKFSASAVQESSVFRDTLYNYSEYNGAGKINLWRGTLYLGGWAYILHRRARLYYDAFWQPAFNNTANYRTQFDAGLDVPVWKGLMFNVLYTFTHENVVVQQVQQNDKILTFGLAYNLKKRQTK